MKLNSETTMKSSNLYNIVSIVCIFGCLCIAKITLFYPQSSLINHDPQLLLFEYVAEHTKMRYVEFGIQFNTIHSDKLGLNQSIVICEIVDQSRSLFTGHNYTLSLPITNEHYYENEIYLKHLFAPGIYLISFLFEDHLSQQIVLLDQIRFELKIKLNFIPTSNQIIYKTIDDINIEIRLTTGIGTYHSIEFDVWSHRNWEVVIGKYCSIGNLQILLSRAKDHRSDFITTFPLHSIQDHFSAITDESILDNSHRIIIGNDVWIGKNVVLINNITIGHGVIIGAYSVIRESIPNYAIVYGNPSQIIKYRFNEEIINTLLRIAWWDWHPDRIYLMTKYSDIEDIITSWENGEL